MRTTELLICEEKQMDIEEEEMTLRQKSAEWEEVARRLAAADAVDEDSEKQADADEIMYNRTEYTRRELDEDDANLHSDNEEYEMEEDEESSSDDNSTMYANMVALPQFDSHGQAVAGFPKTSIMCNLWGDTLNKPQDGVDGQSAEQGQQSGAHGQVEQGAVDVRAGEQGLQSGDHVQAVGTDVVVQAVEQGCVDVQAVEQELQGDAHVQAADTDVVVKASVEVPQGGAQTDAQAAVGGGSGKAQPYNQEVQMELEKCKGTCKMWCKPRKFGFIEMEDGSGDVFVHACDIVVQGVTFFAVGESVEFDVVVQDDGRSKAINVSYSNANAGSAKADKSNGVGQASQKDCK